MEGGRDLVIFLYNHLPFCCHSGEMHISGDTLTCEYVIPKGILALQLCYHDDCLVSLIL